MKRPQPLGKGQTRGTGGEGRRPRSEQRPGPGAPGGTPGGLPLPPASASARRRREPAAGRGAPGRGPGGAGAGG